VDVEVEVKVEVGSGGWVERFPREFGGGEGGKKNSYGYKFYAVYIARRRGVLELVAALQSLESLDAHTSLKLAGASSWYISSVESVTAGAFWHCDWAHLSELTGTEGWYGVNQNFSSVL
jgi:hypothetical protein